MAKVVNIFPSMDEDMKDYHKKIWRHRVSLILKYAAVVAAEVSDNRFTVCPLWPLGNAPIYLIVLELVDGLEPPTC